MRGSIRKVPEALASGDRIIFSQGMGGTGEVVTVESVTYEGFDVYHIHTDEVPFPLEVLTHNTVKLAA
jgi:hypothetical protein